MSIAIGTIELITSGAKPNLIDGAVKKIKREEKTDRNQK
jgi:hypothetical protein